MKSVRNHYNIVIVLILAFCALNAAPLTVSAFQMSASQTILSLRDKNTMQAFEKRAESYSELRESLERKLPKLPKDATPEQIDAHKTAFQKSVQAARRGAKKGEIFTLPAAKMIRSLIKAEYKGKERLELRETVLEADTKGVPLKINYPYPETKELVEMPPRLLLTLPQLPKQLRYRFVGVNLLLVDRENGVIVDYMTNALP